MDRGGFRVQASVWPDWWATQRRGRTVLAWRPHREHPGFPRLLSVPRQDGAPPRPPRVPWQRPARAMIPIDLAALVLEVPATLGCHDADPAAEHMFGSAMLARGLRMTTDLRRIDLGTMPGWRLSVDAAQALTLDWPHRRRLLDGSPVDAPAGWLDAMERNGFALVVAGVGLGLSEPAAADQPMLVRITHAAEIGGVVIGAVTAQRVDSHRHASSGRYTGGVTAGRNSPAPREVSEASRVPAPRDGRDTDQRPAFAGASRGESSPDAAIR